VEIEKIGRMKPHLENRPVPADSSFLCVERNERHFDFNWHVHDCYEIVLIIQGHGQRFIGDHIGHYRKDELVLVGRDLPHSWVSARIGSPPRNRAIYLQFAHDFIGPRFFEVPELKLIARLLERAGRGLLFNGVTAQKAIRDLKTIPNLTGLSRLQRLLEVLNLLASISRHATPLSSATLGQPSHAVDQPKIQAILNRIHANITQRVSLEEVAAAANMTRSTFCRVFKRTMGKTLVEYTNDVRIGRVCMLLAETVLSVSEICFKCGFASLPYFNRRFLASKGVTPSVFRRAISEQNG